MPPPEAHPAPSEPSASCANSAGADRPTELLIPDCCNLGVTLRVLLSVNLALLGANLLQTRGWKQGLLDFVEGSMLVELSCLWSLFALCLLRRALLRPGGPGLAPWLQRAACLLLPAAVSALVVHGFMSAEWMRGGFAHLSALKAALAGALCGALLQHYFELRTRAYSPALVEARLQALQARIRPHFLFNSLNAVLSLIRSEPRRAETALEDLAELFRVLMSDPRNMTTLENEVRLCKQYLSIEKIRLGERLQVTWNIAGGESLPRAQIPVLLLQPLLENAVHYGVEPAPEPTGITIDISRSLESVDIMVANPYRGDTVAAGNQMALQNIRERLRLLYDVESHLSTGISRGLFEVRLHFPYVKGA